MIPGNRPEDQAWEKYLEEIEERATRLFTSSRGMPLSRKLQYAQKLFKVIWGICEKQEYPAFDDILQQIARVFDMPSFQDYIYRKEERK